MAVRIGSQKPTLRIALPYDKTDGDLACGLMKAIGEPPDVAQRGVLDDWLAIGDDDKWVHFLNMLEAPRQNMKTWLIKARMIYGVVIRGERILYTAHNSDTAAEIRDIMLGLTGYRPGDPKATCKWLNKRMSRTRMTNGHEAIYFKNCARIAFSTRTKSSKLGFTVDVIIVDEAQEFREAQAAAILSTAAAAPLKNPQYIFAGTPPTPDCFGDVFQVRRDAIVNGTDDGSEGTVSLNEWSANDIPGFTISPESVRNKDYWYLTNPALGNRINEGTVAGELGTYTDPLTFAQQRLGYWLPKEQILSVIPADKWAACATKDPPDGDISYGVKFARDGSRCALSACINPQDGRPHVELIRLWDMADGMRPVADWLERHADKCACVVIDGVGQATNLATMLREMGVAKRLMTIPTATQCTEAYALMLDRVNACEVTHYDQKQLNAAATTCSRRQIGKGWGFDDTDTGDSTLIESASLALWGATNTKRKPGQKTEAYF